jgi:hypothetical protein
MGKKIGKKDILKYVSFGGAVAGIILWYALNPNYSWSLLGKGWIEMTVIVFSIVALLIGAGKANGVRLIIIDGKITKKEKSFLKGLSQSIFWEYALWGFGQQGFIFGIFGLLYLAIGQWAIPLSAFIFAFLHFPNYLLMLAVFGLSQMFYNFFLKTGNLLPCFLGHGIIASILMYYIPNPIITDWVTWRSFWEKQRFLNDNLKK